MRVEVLTWMQTGRQTHLYGQAQGQRLAEHLVRQLKNQAYHENLIVDFDGVNSLDAALIQESLVQLACRMLIQKEWPNSHWVLENLPERTLVLLEHSLMHEAKARGRLRNLIIPVNLNGLMIPVGKIEPSLLRLWASLYNYPYGFGPRDIRVDCKRSKYWVSTQLKKLTDCRLLRRKEAKTSWGKTHIYWPIFRPCPRQFQKSRAHAGA